MATHSSVLAWRIPGMGEPGGLPPMGLHRVGHDCTHTKQTKARGHKKSSGGDRYAYYLDFGSVIMGICLCLNSSVYIHCVCTKSLQSCPTLCDPMNFNPPGSSIHGILQARILEWIAMPSSRGSCRPRNRTYIPWVFCIGRRVLSH